MLASTPELFVDVAAQPPTAHATAAKKLRRTILVSISFMVREPCIR